MIPGAKEHFADLFDTLSKIDTKLDSLTAELEQLQKLTKGVWPKAKSNYERVNYQTSKALDERASMMDLMR